MSVSDKRRSTNEIADETEGGEDGILHNFGEPWLAAFKQTEAFHVWNSCTDAALFDIIEPK